MALAQLDQANPTKLGHIHQKADRRRLKGVPSTWKSCILELKNPWNKTVLLSGVTTRCKTCMRTVIDSLVFGPTGEFQKPTNFAPRLMLAAAKPFANILESL